MKQQEPNLQQKEGASFIEASNEAFISSLISKSLLLSQNNKLVFISNAISMIKPIAHAYLFQYPETHEPANNQTLLIDFSETEVDYLQEMIKLMALESPKRKLFEKDTSNNLNVIKLSNQTIQKRKIHYLKSGIYSVSSQIFLTDLLRGWNQLHTLKVKIILKLTDKVLSHYHYHAWITTIIRIKEEQRGKQESNVSFIYICNRPQFYADANQLSRIYRTFFCKKVVIWPFGRAQIHKALSKHRQKNVLKQWEYMLSMSEGQRQIYETLMQLYYFLKKKMGSKNEQRMTNDNILYNSIMQEGYNFTKGEYTEIEHIKVLLMHLENSNKITLLNTISKFIESKDCQIWNSNNSEAINIIQQLLEQLQSSVIQYQQLSNPIPIDLMHLFRHLQGLDFEINLQKQSQFTCEYLLHLSLLIKPQINQKFNEIIKIIQSIKDPQPQQKYLQNIQDQIIQDFATKNRSNSDHYHNVLIVCGAKGAQRFIKENFEAYLTDNTYLHYIRSLYRFLSLTRAFRIKKIKKIYDRKKVKKSQERNESKKTGDKNTWIEQNKLLMKQILFHQLLKLNQILLNFEVQLQMINEESKKETNSQIVFQRNNQESKLLQTFNQNLLNASFNIIDYKQIKPTYINSRLNKIVLDSNHTKKRIFVDHQARGIQPNHFYQLLDNINPSSIIFYTPIPLLLRSLYLYQLQNEIQNLKHVHILSYQNSYQAKKASFEVTRQDKAFWSISQHRAQLPQFSQSPFLRVKNINFRDSIEQARHEFNKKSMFRDEEGESSISKFLTLSETKRKILVDTREFKSSLPSYLYHFGFEVIPVFLKAADYILADDTAIEKKSIHTKDLHNSIKSLRLDEQLKKMSSQFRHPYLLIECEQESDFIKSNFGFIDGTSGNKSRYQLRKKLIQLLHKYPNVRVIWSASVGQSCQLIRQLKQDKQDPDVSKYVKEEGEQSQQKGERRSLGRISQSAENKQEEEQSILG